MASDLVDEPLNLIVRYEAYLDYLKRLENVYSSGDSNIADLTVLRQRLADEED